MAFTIKTGKYKGITGSSAIVKYYQVTHFHCPHGHLLGKPIPVLYRYLLLHVMYMYFWFLSFLYINRSHTRRIDVIRITLGWNLFVQAWISIGINRLAIFFIFLFLDGFLTSSSLYGELLHNFTLTG